MRFRSIIFFFLLGLLFCHWVHAQDESPFSFSGPKVSPETILAEIIRFPDEALKSKKNGRVVYQVKIDSLGRLESARLIEATDSIFKDEALKAINYLQANWYTELLDSKTPNTHYLVVLSFLNPLVQENPTKRFEKANRFLKKGKPEKSISILDRLILEFPYSKEYFQSRAFAFQQIGNVQAFQKDSDQFTKLETTLLANLTTYSFANSSRSKVPISF